MSCLNVAITGFVLGLVLSFSTGRNALADANSETDESSESVVFVPPDIGVPQDRMGAGTRGGSATENAENLKLLVPQGGGLTTLPWPPLVWRLQQGHRGDLIVGLKPIDSTGVELMLTGPFPPGDFGLNLERVGYQLEPDRVYEWSVALLDQNSNAVIAHSKSLIERVPDRLKNDNPAAAGIWFDALSNVVEISLSGRVNALNPGHLDLLLSTAGVDR